METDVHILALLRARDGQAISSLERAFGALCRSIIRSSLDNEADVEECLQDVWLAV